MLPWFAENEGHFVSVGENYDAGGLGMFEAPEARVFIGPRERI